ncbi:MAG: CRISPR system precrRNA processing endoribonuclease RAMP protein Cas6 [Oscillibacter sp.]|nr:CRISPR system precrRNA processing endoribonuclease RAMP protein Cas6 [Oscillibacter sp.]
MIQYRFSVRAPDGRPLSASMAYPMYSWLLSQAPSSYGTLLHEQGRKPISQYLCRDRKPGQFVWTVSCLDEASHEALAPALRNLAEIPLRASRLQAALLDVSTVQSVADFMEAARKQEDAPFYRLTFCSPTAFKHDGSYVIFPETRLLIQSLAEKWDSVFSDYPLSDAEALEAFQRGLRITDYRLQSCRFSMKQTQIPSFTGEVTLKARLSSPMMELWKCLVEFSRFSGIGIKTTLGMGGVSFTEHK